MSIGRRFTLIAALACSTFFACASAPVHAAPIALSQEPLYVTNRIKPAFIMAIDDSGSMQWETLFPTQDGRATWRGPASSFFHPTDIGPDGKPRHFRSAEAGTNGLTNYLELFPFPERGTATNTIPPLPNFGFARAPEFNPSAFNPFTSYEPWARADRSLWPNAIPTAARVDPRLPAGRIFDLTSDVRRDENNWRFDFRVGMTIPAGTVYSRNPGNDCNFGGTQIGTTGWWTLDADFVSTQNCAAGVSYYPATFFLTSPTFPGYTATPLAIVNPAGGPPSTTLYRFEIRPENMTAPAYAAAMQNFANYFQYYRNRNLSLIAALTRAFVDIDFMRVGVFRINVRGAVTMFDMGIPADRAAFYDQITPIDGNFGTPNRWAIDHLGSRFRQTGTGAPVQLACQMNAGMLFTDGYSNEGGPTVGNRDGALGVPFQDGIADKKGDIVARHFMENIRPDLPSGMVRVPPACASPTPDPRLNCRTDPHMTFYGVTLGALGTVYGVDTAATADPFASPPAWPGRCDNCLEAVDELWQATLIGRGRYINASNPAAISQAINDVVNAVLDSTQPTGTPGVAGARVGSDSAIFQTTFAALNNARDWPGNVQAFRVNADGSTGPLIWDAASLLPAAGSRNILAMRTPGTAATRSVVDFVSANFGATEADRASAIGVSLSSFAANFTAGLTMDDAFNYLRGDQSQEYFLGVRPLGFRARSGRIGSIINSSAEVETNRTFYPAFDALAGALGESYRAYQVSKRASFTNTVFVGANAGMMHAFNADTGAELFAYVPNGALPQAGLLLNRNYQHRYFVDGHLNATDAVVSGVWRTVLLGNQGRGGRSVFAIDVTNPAAVDASRVMWELPTSDNDLGVALNRVEVMYGEDGSWYAVFANGINSTNSNPVLYLVNLSTGDVVRRITADDGGSYTNGLTRIALADTNGNGRTDAVYGGDLRGNLWKFDLSAGASSGWGVAFSGDPLFRAEDHLGDLQPITGGISVSRGPSGGVMVHFGTGRYLSDTDATSTGPHQLQSFYGVWDRGSASDMTRASLQAQSITGQFGSGSSLGRTISNNRVNFSTHNGWFLDLRNGPSPPSGERFIGDPRIIGETITFPTSEPSADSACAPGLRSWGYRVDRFSGNPVLNRMERAGGSPVCPTTGCGALLVQTSGSPVTGSLVVQPQRPCRRGIDPECPLIADPALIIATCGSPNPGDPTFNPNFDICVNAASAGASASLMCSISNPIGTQDFGGEPQVCGRQSWRQIR